MNKIIYNFLSLFWESLPYLHKTLWFNFKYLPFSQAKHLPFLFLSKSYIRIGKGKLTISSGKIHFGMIKLGQNYHTNRPDTGVHLSFKEGHNIIFHGTASFGHNTCIEVGSKGTLEIGNNCVATYGLLMYAYNKLFIGDNCRIGWDSVIMDTSFHSLKLESGGRTKGYGSIVIGNNVWIPSFCRVMAGAKIPDEIVFGSGSYISKDYTNIPPKSLVAGNPLQIKKTGIWRDTSDDMIEY